MRDVLQILWAIGYWVRRRFSQCRNNKEPRTRARCLLGHRVRRDSRRVPSQTRLPPLWLLMLVRTRLARVKHNMEDSGSRLRHHSPGLSGSRSSATNAINCLPTYLTENILLRSIKWRFAVHDPESGRHVNRPRRAGCSHFSWFNQERPFLATLGATFDWGTWLYLPSLVAAQNSMIQPLSLPDTSTTP